MAKNDITTRCFKSIPRLETVLGNKVHHLSGKNLISRMHWLGYAKGT